MIFIRLLVVVMSCSWALAGWRNAPRLAHRDSLAWGLSIAVAIGVAYWLGCRSQRAAAIATAVASAKAEAVASAISGSSSVAQQAVSVHLNVAPGAPPAYSVPSGLDAAPWMVGAAARPVLDDPETLIALTEDGDGRLSGGSG
jgi:hypothetical protein